MNDGLGDAAWLALVAVVPLVALMLTSFVKMSVVLSLLRNAIGATDAPSGLVVMGLSLVLTFFVMAPVAVEMVTAAGMVAPAPTPGAPDGTAPAGKQPDGVNGGSAARPSRGGGVSAETSSSSSAGPPSTGGTASTGRGTGVGAEPASTGRETGVGAEPASTGRGTGAAVPGSEQGVAAETSPRPAVPAKPLELETAVRALLPAQHHAKLDALERGLVPLRSFLERHAGARDRATFVDLATRMGRSATGDELWVLAPAFLTTELREAFAIAVLIFVPFLVIDLLVGLGLAALGLSTTSPQTVALPIKLLLFVAVDGWRLLVESLLKGYV
ncbi:MAG: hypothetical protein SFX73_04940 [Kofleriaceae bacterium]|nr:hypothetical protein [Kofleriaceae bacterium]